MYMVYWTEYDDATPVTQAQAFASSQMGAALHFMEQLRIRQRAGEAIRFVTLCSENPHAVGHAGAAVRRQITTGKNAASNVPKARAWSPSQVCTRDPNPLQQISS